jgi:hypothetical protein
MQVMPDKPDPLALSGRIYNLLLYAYPASFRREYGRPMAQLFRDEARDTLQGSGTAGLIGLWFLTLFDLLKTAIAEHIWEVFHMPLQKLLQRWSGPAAAIAGLLWVSPSLIEVEGNLGILLYAPAFLLMAVGLAGLYQRLSASQRLASRLAFGVALMGLLIMLAVALFLLIPVPDAANFFFGTLWGVLVAFLPIIAGFAGMGVIAISTGALGRLSFVPLAQAAFMLGILFTLSDSGPNRPTPPAQTTFLVLFGISWILLGFALWSTPEDAPSPELPA